MKNPTLNQFNLLKAKSLKLYQNKEYDKSISHSEKALNLAISLYGKNNPEIPLIYNSIASSYSGKCEYEKAFEYFHKSLTIYLHLGNTFEYEIAAIYNNISVCFAKKSKDNLRINKSDFKNSVLYYKKSLSIYLKIFGLNNIHIAILYNNLSSIYIRAGFYRHAYKFLFRSFCIYRNVCGSDSLEFSFSLMNLSKYFFLTMDYRRSIKLLKRSLNVLSKNKNFRTHLPSRYKNLSMSFMKLGNFNKAIHFIDKALSLYLKLNNATLKKLIETDPHLDLLEILKFKSEIYHLKFKSGNEIPKLIISYEHSIFAIKLIDSIRQSYFYGGSKNLLSMKVVPVYEKAIEVCIELHKIYNDDKYINEAYLYSQKSKSLSLIENIKDYDAKLSANIPPVILRQELNLKKKISKLEKLLYEENKKTVNSRLKTDDLRDKLFNLKQKFEALVKKLETEFPEYYNLKYDFKPASADEIKKQIPEGTMIIEYFLGDENIFAFVFTRSEYYVNQISKSKSFDIKIKTYRNLLTQNAGILDGITAAKFSELSYYFYKVLLKDILKSHINVLSKNRAESIPVKNILIVPDNELNFIPFDSLITHNHNNNVSFKELPYLIKYFNIIFCYSTILYLKSLNDAKKKSILNILAFAPVFKNHNGRSKKSLTENFRNSLSPLNYNQKEVKEISKNFSGRYYFDKEAVKEKFVNNKKQFSILHFATHSVVDDENPMYSKIVFSKSGNETDEGYLHTYEIYTLNSKYDLVVLSACNTGFGRMIRGEGIMSVARAFASSGSKNIVMSLWQVNDKSTSEIMKMFYRNIANGEKVGEALRNAKLKYLDNSDELKAMPFYWSAFISFGDNDSLVKT